MGLALYRKYRPATFAEVVGQEHVTEPLRIALAAGRINHAYLFSGPRGCGKTSSARILARSLNCVQVPTPDPCGVCGSCVALAPEGPGSLDVVELDAASHGGVDDTRDLRDRAFYMPAESRFRVFIIDEAHMVTPQGFNALLKIVEEPPEHLVFIFATTEPDKVLTTIRSRTHHYPFRLIAPTTLRAPPVARSNRSQVMESPSLNFKSKPPCARTRAPSTPLRVKSRTPAFFASASKQSTIVSDESVIGNIRPSSSSFRRTPRVSNQATVSRAENR